MINEKTDLDDSLRDFVKDIKDDPFILESEMEAQVETKTKEYEIKYIIPELKEKCIEEELEEIAKINHCTLERLIIFAEENELVYGYHSGYTTTQGYPTGNIVYSPKNCDFKVNDFVFFKTFVGNDGMHCIGGLKDISLCTGEGRFVDTNSELVPNPFKIKRESKEINKKESKERENLKEDDIDSDVDLDSLPTMVKNFVECYMANPDMLKAKFLPIYREIMLNKKIHSFSNGDDVKKYYDSISLYNKIKADYTKIKYCKDNNISLHLYALDKSATHYKISADNLKSIIAAKNGSKAKKY